MQGGSCASFSAKYFGITVQLRGVGDGGRRLNSVLLRLYAFSVRTNYTSSTCCRDTTLLKRCVSCRPKVATSSKMCLLRFVVFQAPRQFDRSAWTRTESLNKTNKWLLPHGLLKIAPVTSTFNHKQNFFRIMNESWIWWKTSFLPLTLRTTWRFWRISRRWQRVSSFNKYVLDPLQVSQEGVILPKQTQCLRMWKVGCLDQACNNFTNISAGYDKENKTHHSLLTCLLMTSCDLSDQTKNWKNTKKIAVSTRTGGTWWARGPVVTARLLQSAWNLRLRSPWWVLHVQQK